MVWKDCPLYEQCQNIKEQFSEENSGRLQSIQAGALINSNITNIISKDIIDVIDIVNQKNNDLTSESLIDYYQSAEPNEKEIIDNVFKLICGIRFEVILKRLGIQS